MTIRAKLTFIFILCILLVFFSLFWIDHFVHTQRLEESLQQRFSLIEHDFYDRKETDIASIKAVIDVFSENEAFKKIFLERNREKLYQYGQLLFKKLKERYGFTHFYFHLPNGDTFVRLHNHKLFGDYNNRITFKHAKDSERVSSGIELGKTAFALRVVSPYYYDNELIGYIEIGEEIDHFLTDLKKKMGDEVITFVDKRFLNQQDWNSEIKVKNIRDNWNDFEKFVITGSTLKELFPELYPIIENLSFEDIQNSSDFLTDFRNKGKRYRGGLFPLIDINKRQVGGVLILRDISEIIQQRKLENIFKFNTLILLFIVSLLLFNFIASTSVVRPIREFAAITKKMAGGNLKERLNLVSNDQEIKDLTQSFNTMADSIELIVNERTNHLKESEHRKSAILETALDCIITIDQKGNIIDFNPAAEKTFGYSFQEIKGKKMGELIIPPVFRDAFYKGLNRYPSTEEAHVVGKRIEIRAMRSDASEFPVELAVTPVKTEDTLVFIGYLRDITEQKKAKNELEANEKKLRNITDTLGEGVYVSDRNGILSFMNPEAEHLLGWKESELLGKSIHEIIHPVDNAGKIIDKKDCPIHRIITSEKKQYRSDNDIFLRKDGHSFPVACVTSPLISNSKVEGTVTVFRDITERKQAETELLHSKEEAESANRAKDNFLAVMSHEMRTPLNGILGMADLLGSTSLDEEQKQYKEIIYTSGQNLLARINDILDISKIKTGIYHKENIDFNLEKVLSELTNLFAITIENKNLTFHYDFPHIYPKNLTGDPFRLKQILSNLLGNAVKFTEKGAVSLKLEILNETEQEVTFNFAVQDTGIGIESKLRAQIFHSFTQGDNSSTRKYAGTGLGLSIANNLIELMGGKMILESVVNEGSTFLFDLTFAKQQKEKLLETTTPPARKSKFVASVPGRNTLDKSRLLVVEDDAINQAVISGILLKLGYEIDIASNGKEALRLVENATYDLVFMDCLMPQMDGYATTKAIRKLEEEGELPKHLIIVALTAKAMKGDREECLNAGMDDYISKPISKDILVNILDFYQIKPSLTN